MTEQRPTLETLQPPGPPTPVSPFVDVPYVAPGEGRPAVVSLAAALLFIYALGEMRAFVALMYAQNFFVLLAVADSILCILAYVVCAFGLLRLAPWARKGTLVMLGVRVVLAYTLMAIFMLGRAGTIVSPVEHAGYLNRALQHLLQSFGVSLLTLLPIVLILTRRGVIAAFAKKAGEERG